jgi:aldoxime dehydratase
MSDLSDSNDYTVPGAAESGCPVRRFPLRRPKDHKPPIARYSAALPQASQVAVLFLGLQSKNEGAHRSVLAGFLKSGTIDEHAPVYTDHAVFTDKEGYLNHVVALYWLDARSYHSWLADPAVAAWRAGAATARSIGVWWEPIVVDGERAETITFKEFRRGFSGCPASALRPTEGSGYWGAARDRISSAAHDLFEPTIGAIVADLSDSTERHRAIKPPMNMAVIRSGVSWEKCEGEQLQDYLERIKPKLDDGMSYLRDNPGQTGCFALRQVISVGGAGEALPEAYSLGAFVSLGHLEAWAEHHPSHLAIYTRAMAARRKYQDALQLRTYNEIFIIDERNPEFEYFNCHPQTGLLPYADLIETNSQ